MCKYTDGGIVEISDFPQFYNEFIGPFILLGIDKQIKILRILHIQLTCQINDDGVFFIHPIDIDFADQPEYFLMYFSMKITFKLKNVNET